MKFLFFLAAAIGLFLLLRSWMTPKRKPPVALLDEREARAVLGVAPDADAGTPGLRLAQADADDPLGRQAGPGVGFFLQTSDFAAQHARMAAAGVTFLEEPRHEPYGTVAVFADLNGQRWDLIQPA